MREEKAMLHVEELEQMFSVEKKQMIRYMIATSNICLAVTWQRGSFFLCPRADLGPKGKSDRGADFESNN